jgi:hypothetical protein
MTPLGRILPMGVTIGQETSAGTAGTQPPDPESWRGPFAVGQLCTVRYIVWGTLIPFCVTLIS